MVWPTWCCAPRGGAWGTRAKQSLEEHYAHLLVHGALHARAGTTKPANRMRGRWKPTKPPSWGPGVLPTRTPPDAARDGPRTVSMRHRSRITIQPLFAMNGLKYWVALHLTTKDPMTRLRRTPMYDTALLLTAAFVAGALNAVAGGGSFLTLPRWSSPACRPWWPTPPAPWRCCRATRRVPGVS